MTENEHQTQELRLKRIDTFIAAFGAVGVVASIWIGFSGLTSQSREQTTALKNEWSRKFYDEKLALYSQATEAAAKLATLKSKGAPENQIEDAKMQFKILYWGPMCVTEGNDVESAMVLFQRGVDAGATPQQLEQLSLLLAHVCKNEAHLLYLPTEGVASKFGPSPQILQQMEKIVTDAKALQKQP